MGGEDLSLREAGQVHCSQLDPHLLELHNWQAVRHAEVLEGLQHRPVDARRPAGCHHGPGGPAAGSGRGAEVRGQALQQRLRPQVPRVGDQPHRAGDCRCPATVCESPVLPAEAAPAYDCSCPGIGHGRRRRPGLRVRPRALREGRLLCHERDQARGRGHDLDPVHHPPHHVHQERLPARARGREPVGRDGQGVRHRERGRGG
mmetsp:Transcript_61797/g.175527  ORF Transcript_61797/g.175527 Transcript_61797/m.175527 type:complete len:203 (-) Transcript_61797:335-943(-)